MMYFITIHDATGQRTGDEGDNLLTASELEADLRNYTFGEVKLGDRKLYRTADEGVFWGVVEVE